MFQFHEGPIKTLNSMPIVVVAYRFQFHEGPIKTRPYAGKIPSVLSFNSMKVRLKQRNHE